MGTSSSSSSESQNESKSSSLQRRESTKNLTKELRLENYIDKLTPTPKDIERLQKWEASLPEG
jgi:hypothetical protein